MAETKGFRFQHADSRLNMDGYWAVDLSGKILDVNTTYCNMLGSDRESILRMSIPDIDPFEDPAETKSRIQRIKKSGAERFEACHQKKDGSVMDVEISAFFDHDRDQMICFLRDITDQKKVETLREESIEIQKMLLRIAGSFINAPLKEIDMLIQSALRDLSTYVDADRAYVSFLDFERQMATMKYEWCRKGVSAHLQFRQDVPLSSFPEMVDAHRHQEPYKIDQLDSMPSSDMKAIMQNQLIKSVITLPMIKDKRCIGFVGFDWVRNLHQSSEIEEQMLHIFAQLLVNIEIRRESYLSLVKSNTLLETFLRVSQAMNQSFELEPLMKKIVDHATKVMNLDSGAVYLLEDQNTVRLEATLPALPSGFPDAFRLALLTDHPHVQKAILSGQPVIIPDTSTATLTPAEQEIIRIRNLRSNLYVPIRLRGKTLGALILSSTANTHSFQKEEIFLLQGFADQAAQVIHNVRVYEETKQHEEELENEIAKREQAEESLQYHYRFQQLISEIAAECVVATRESFDTDVSSALQRIGTFLQADRSYLYDFSEDLKTISLSHEWNRKGILPKTKTAQKEWLDSQPWLRERILSEQIVHIPDVLALPDHADAEKRVLTQWGIKSLIIIPIWSSGKLWGFMGYDMFQKPYQWSEYEIDQLKVVGALIGDLLANIANEEALILAKEESDAANRAKSQFLANMSHELRTPLNGVIGFTELLQSSELDDGQAEYVGYILRSAKNLLDVVSRILEFVHVKSGSFQLREEETDLQGLCQKTMEMFRFQAREKGLMLFCHIDPYLKGNWMVDPLRLQEVLLNLVGNAVKFTDHGKVQLLLNPLGVSPGSTAQQTRISIQDTGIGISKDLEERIFQAFEQADMSHTRRYGGTGIGLSVAQAILNQMQSSLCVESQPGEGATFFFDLCLKRKEEFPEPLATFEGAQKYATIDSQKMNALVVEDDFLNARLLRAFLDTRFPGVHITEARSGEEALAAYPTLQPDIVLMDIQMPGIDGFEAASKIREIEKTMGKRVPIIAVTAAVEEVNLEKCNNSGMDDYLLKPLHFGEAEATLRKWIGF